MGCARWRLLPRRGWKAEAIVCGNLQLSLNEVLYVVCGGTGTNGGGTGGYNGGGNAGSYYGNGTGGGATHVAKTSGTLKELESNKSAIFIVAGGGGGGSNATDRHGPGGVGGGTSYASASVRAMNPPCLRW